MRSTPGDLYACFDADPAPITAFVRWLVNAHAVPQPLHVLDIGCGTGRMLAEYTNLGWRATGLEPDGDFYLKARKTIGRRNSVRLVQGGFQTLEAVEEYDLITAINDPFAYLLDVQARVDALGKMYRALRPGGLMFLEIKHFLHKLLYHEPFTDEVALVEDKRVAHLMQHEVDLHNARWIHRDEYLVEGSREAITKTHELAIISPPELLYFIEQQGFVDIRTYSSYAARSSEPLTGRLILISARKPQRQQVQPSSPTFNLSSITFANF